MNSSLPKDNYSLLNEEKKAKIMQDLREEIDKQKSQYSLSEDQINNLQNNNIFNSNELKLKNLNLNENETEKDDDEDEEHMEILNNAKNVLNQIQNDINKFTKTYGSEKIMPKKNNDNELNEKLKKNNISSDIYDENDNDNESNGSLSNYDEEEEEKNNEKNDEYEEEVEGDGEDNDEQINYMEENEMDDNQYNDYNNNENEENQDNYEINYDNFNENNNNIIQNQNKNASIKFNQFNSQKNNQITYQNNISNQLNNEDNDEYQNEVQENNYTNKSNNANINYSRYNFDNPLGYNNDFMKKNISSNIYAQYQNNIKTKNTQKNNSKNKAPNPKKSQHKKFNKSGDNIFAQKNREKFLSMKKELEDKFAQEHPFKPKINKVNFSNKNKNKILTETEQERYNRLSRPKILDLNEKKRKRDLEELKKISELNTIKPTYKVNPKEVSNRLYKISNELKQKKDQIKKSYEESQNKEYSFAPEINPYSKMLMDKYELKPIYERNEDFEKQKLNNIIKKRQEIEKEQKQRCKPKINSNSKKIVENQKNNGLGFSPYEDVYEKLYKENINKDTKNLATRDLKECTFTPKVNPISNLLVSNNNINYNINNINNEENMKDFLERQKMYEDLRKKKLEKNKQNNNQDYTFKPEINSNSDLLVKCIPERFNENQFDKYSRLYQDAQKIKIKKEKLENEINNKYDFTPKINELSKYIGRKPDFDELNIIHEKVQKIDDKEEEYDFTPELYQNSKYKNIKSNYKNDQGILNRINEEMQNKKEKIETLQKMKENNDISKFNFTPEINKAMPDFENNKPMYMKGMARYLNQMEKARQAKRDKEQREKEVFITGEGWNKNNGITVPKPFKLSYQNNIKKDCDKEEKKDCGLKIKNNENKNREIIKKLLNGN